MSRRTFKGKDDEQSSADDKPSTEVSEVDADEARAREGLEELDRWLKAEEEEDDFEGFLSQAPTAKSSPTNTPAAPMEAQEGAFNFGNMGDAMFVDSARVVDDDADDEQDVFAPKSQPQSLKLSESPPPTQRMPASFFRAGRRNAIVSDDEVPKQIIMRPAERRTVEGGKYGHVVKRARLDGDYEDSDNKGRE